MCLFYLKFTVSLTKKSACTRDTFPWVNSWLYELLRLSLALAVFLIKSLMNYLIVNYFVVNSNLLFEIIHYDCFNMFYRSTYCWEIWVSNEMNFNSGSRLNRLLFSFIFNYDGIMNIVHNYEYIYSLFPSSCKELFFRVCGRSACILKLMVLVIRKIYLDWWSTGENLSSSYN